MSCHQSEPEFTHSRNYLGYLTVIGFFVVSGSTHSRNYSGYLTALFPQLMDISTHSRNYLGYLTLYSLTYTVYLHTVEII